MKNIITILIFVFSCTISATDKHDYKKIDVKEIKKIIKIKHDEILNSKTRRTINYEWNKIKNC